MSFFPDYTPTRRERFRRWRERRFGKQIIIPPHIAEALKASSVGMFNPPANLYEMRLKAMDEISHEDLLRWTWTALTFRYTLAQRIVNRFWRIMEWF